MRAHAMYAFALSVRHYDEEASAIFHAGRPASTLAAFITFRHYNVILLSFTTQRPRFLPPRRWATVAGYYSPRPRSLSFNASAKMLPASRHAAAGRHWLLFLFSRLQFCRHFSAFICFDKMIFHAFQNVFPLPRHV